jgi:hypothetical protein
LVQLGNNALVPKRELKENLPGIYIQYSHLGLGVQHCIASVFDRWKLF